jgi:hypothetical protein
MAIIISRRTGGGGIRKLSDLEIDIDKNWAGHRIGNISGLSANGDLEIFGNYEEGGINLGVGFTKTHWDVFDFSLVYNIDEAGIGENGYIGIGFSSSRDAFNNGIFRSIFYERKTAGDYKDAGIWINVNIPEIGQYMDWRVNAFNGFQIITSEGGYLRVGSEIRLEALYGALIYANNAGLVCICGNSYEDLIEIRNTGGINIHSNEHDFNVNVGGNIVLNPAGIVNFSDKPAINLHSLQIQPASIPSPGYFETIYAGYGDRTTIAYLDELTEELNIYKRINGMALYNGEHTFDIGITYYYDNRIRISGYVCGLSSDVQMDISTWDELRIFASRMMVDVDYDIQFYSTALSIGCENLTIVSGEIDFRQSNIVNLVMQKWTSTTRPNSPAEGQIGYNTDTKRLEYWDGTTWKEVATL